MLATLVWSGAGAALDPGSLPWWGRTPAYAAIVVAVSGAVRTPLALWSGLIRERRWGFSTQRLRSWAADRAKAVGVNIVLTAVALLGLVGFARALPGWWAAPAAAAFAFAALLLSFVAPVVLEPLFNRYSPLQDATLAAELRRLAERAGVPIRDVLVQDTSRRTRKANAYVSGLARTRRVVVSDTLLEQASPTEVRLVVAHELAHRRERHVLLGTLLTMAGAVTATVIVWVLLGTRVGDPHRSSSPATGPPTQPSSADSPRRTSPTSIRRACSTCCSSRTRPRPSASRPQTSVADSRRPSRYPSDSRRSTAVPGGPGGERLQQLVARARVQRRTSNEVDKLTT